MRLCRIVFVCADTNSKVLSTQHTHSMHIRDLIILRDDGGATRRLVKIKEILYIYRTGAGAGAKRCASALRYV